MDFFSGTHSDAVRARAGETIEPLFKSDAYHCLSCEVFAPRYWTELRGANLPEKGMGGEILWADVCTHCAYEAYWLASNLPPHAIAAGLSQPRLIHPKMRNKKPAADMPEEIRADYVEAGRIVGDSPRGACALLRLAVQKLMPHVGGTGKDLNGDIGSLVADGLSVQVQEALDSLRVIGNHAVHPGQLDLRDDVETATALFSLLEYVVDQLITQPRLRKELFAKLPASSHEAIARRDAPPTP